MSATLDSAWVRWVNRREPQAFEELVRQYAAMVYGTCLRVLRNPTDAEDVAQECFEELVRKPDLSGVRVPGAWLHGTATYRSLTRLRSDERRKQREIAYADRLASETPPTREELADCVDECIAELPEETRFLLVQYFLCGRTQQDIARELRIPRRTLGHRIESGLNLLGVALRKRGIVVEAVALTGLLTAFSSTASAAPQTLIASLGKLAMAQSAHSSVVPAANALVTSLKLPAIFVTLSVAALLTILGFADKSTPQPSGVLLNAEVVAPSDSAAPNTSARIATATGAELVAKVEEPTVDPSFVTISGTVVDEDDLIPADVRIGLKRRNSSGSPVQNTASVDHDGKFVWTGPLPDLSQGVSSVECTLYYCESAIVSTPYSALLQGRMQIPTVESPLLNLTPGQRVEGVKVIVPSARYAIDGTVRDERGKAIMGANLTIHSRLPNAQATTDTSGRFRFARLYPYESTTPKQWNEPPQHWFMISATHPDYDKPSNTLVRLGARGVNIVLPDKRYGWVSGTALDEKTHRPLVGTKVWVGKVLRSDGVELVMSSEESGETVANGKFTLQDIPEGKSEVWASAPGYGPVCEAIDVWADNGTEGIDLTLNKSGKVTLSLGNIPDDCPAQIANVYAYQPDGDPSINFWSKREENGPCAIELAPGQYTVVAAVSAGYQYFCFAQRVYVESGDAQNIEVGSFGTARLTGTIAPPPGNQRLSFALSLGVRTAPVPEKYADRPPNYRGGPFNELVKDGIFVCGPCATNYDIEWLHPGTYTLTILAFDDDSEQITQTSKTFSLAEGEELPLEIVF